MQMTLVVLVAVMQAAPSDATAAARETMVARQIAARGVRTPTVLAAMRQVPRHQFVPPALAGRAYQDTPLPIGHQQTISQPYIVALMTELAVGGRAGGGGGGGRGGGGGGKGLKVLEVGTGSGYQAAVLAALGATVYSIEIVEPLGRQAAATLERLGYGDRVKTRIGDGYRGWPEAAPFDAIVVTAAPPRVPPPLKEQLTLGGRLVIPVGDDVQELQVITRTASGFRAETVAPVRFVPMTGKAGDDRGN